MQLHLKESASIIINFGGKDYSVKRPKLGACKAFEDAMDLSKQNKTGTVGIVMQFLNSSGLPMEVLEELDGEQLEAVIEVLNTGKKK